MNMQMFPTHPARGSTFSSFENTPLQRVVGNNGFIPESLQEHSFPVTGPIDLSYGHYEPVQFPLVSSEIDSTKYRVATNALFEDSSARLQFNTGVDSDPQATLRSRISEYSDSRHLYRIHVLISHSIETEQCDLKSQIWSLQQGPSRQDSVPYNQLGLIHSQLSATQAQHQWGMRYTCELQSQYDALHKKCTALETRLADMERKSQGLLLVQDIFKITPEYVRTLLDQHSQHEFAQRQARWNWQNMQQTLKSLQVEHKEVASKVDDHEAENAHLHGRLQEFLGHVTGGLGEVAKFIQTQYPGAPTFNGVQSLLDLEEGVDVEDEDDGSEVSASRGAQAPVKETGR